MACRTDGETVERRMLASSHSSDILGSLRGRGRVKQCSDVVEASFLCRQFGLVVIRIDGIHGERGRAWASGDQLFRISDLAVSSAGP